MIDLPRPALVVLVGPAGSGKTTWARTYFAGNEVVSADALRAMVGSGEADLDASADAFAVLDAVVGARLRRGLTTVVDTLGLDHARRRSVIALGRAAGLPCVAVVFTTALDVCRARNRDRDRPVPAPALRSQHRRTAQLDLAEDGLDIVLSVDTGPPVPSAPVAAESAGSGSGGALVGTGGGPGGAGGTGTGGVPVGTGGPRPDGPGLRFGLQVSAFPWGADPRGWLRDVAIAAEQAGFAALSVMDHLIQIPQVGRAWDPIPEAYVTLGFLAGVTDRIHVGPLVTPVTFRSAPLLAKMLATLDSVAPGRVFCGLGAGWFAREHAAYGLPGSAFGGPTFPPPGARLDALAETIGVLRAFWGPGTKPIGRFPETTCYPRPGPIPILVGGGGERRTLRIAATLGDGCNLPSTADLDRKLAVFRGHAAAAGRPVDELRTTVLDLPIVGADPDEVARLVERHRGRSSAATYAAAHHAGPPAAHIARYADLAAKGVDTVFVSLPDLTGPVEIARFAPIVAAFT
ncbi:LLM class flavin-dependent oxidoreductase [Nakamurella sp.]|uniref:LLM class flavin-dependent oxidoreductase n=1 Tax=Nakamurella sp. TaxID=1869182 RepID=UPI003B3A29A0